MGYFMAALDTTILITTLGKITSEFGSIERIGWVSRSKFSLYLGVLKRKRKIGRISLFTECKRLPTHLYFRCRNHVSDSMSKRYTKDPKHSCRGQQITYCACVIIFSAGSILCALSNSMTMLIICRGIYTLLFNMISLKKKKKN
jgi:MFS family permease